MRHASYGRCTRRNTSCIMMMCDERGNEIRPNFWRIERYVYEYVGTVWVYVDVSSSYLIIDTWPTPNPFLLIILKSRNGTKNERTISQESIRLCQRHAPNCCAMIDDGSPPYSCKDEKKTSLSDVNLRHFLMRRFFEQRSFVPLSPSLSQREPLIKSVER